MARRASHPDAPVAALAVLGMMVAGYLALFQAGAVRTVFEPVFGDGSRWILRRSPLVQWLGFPDAIFGVLAYGAEAALSLHLVVVPTGRPAWEEIVLGAVVAGMTMGSAGLVALQAVYGHGCSLCLVSAAVTFTIASATLPRVVPTAMTAWRHRPRRTPPATSRPGNSIRSRPG